MNTQVKETTLPSSTTLRLVSGDITSETTNATVNAANERLQHGASVAGAISRRGGLNIQVESDDWVRRHVSDFSTLEAFLKTWHDHINA